MSNVMFDFSDQYVLITGSSRGIGKETAKLFLHRGATVILTGTAKNPSSDLIAELSALGTVLYETADFITEGGINEFISRLDNHKKIDVCVNNAGINLLDEVENISDDDYQKVLSVNLNAPVKISRYFAKRMKEQEYGRIVNVASIWSVITRPSRGVYSITKNAIIGLTQTMGIELASSGVIVNAISPGFTLTELTKNTNTYEQLDKISKNIPINRLADPIEIGYTILFLCSKENSYMTGQNIIVDGGFTNV